MITEIQAGISIAAALLLFIWRFWLRTHELEEKINELELKMVVKDDLQHQLSELKNDIKDLRIDIREMLMKWEK